MHHVADHIKIHSEEGQVKDYLLYFVPRRTMICETVLKEEKVYGEIKIGELQLDILPYDYDLLSMDLETSYRECALDGDRTSLFYVARALMKLQAMYGTIPQIFGKGSCAKTVAEMLVRMRRETPITDGIVAPKIDSLLLIDREVDLITPLCSQLTYEGLIDEVFGVEHGYVSLPAEMIETKEPPKDANKKMKFALNSGDKVYSEIRDLNFSVVGPLLAQKTKSISQQYDERHGVKTVGQMKDYVQKLPAIQIEHRSLGIHTNVAEVIMRRTREPDFHRLLESEQAIICGHENSRVQEYIEDCIGRQEPLLKVLRLVCLMSLAANGLKPKTLDALRDEILQAYGFEYLPTLNNLERLGMCRRQDGRSTFSQVRKSLRLVVDNIDERAPTDISYVYSGCTTVCASSRGAGEDGVAGHGRYPPLTPGTRL
eukprot:Opistho-2@69810